jgi:hypothetical protein
VASPYRNHKYKRQKWWGFIDEIHSSSAIARIWPADDPDDQYVAEMYPKSFEPGHWQQLREGSYISLPAKRGGKWQAVQTPKFTKRMLKKSRIEGRRMAKLFEEVMVDDRGS